MTLCNTILVVKNVPDFPDRLSHALQRGGYAIRMAHSGAEALEIARAVPPNMILMDAWLPDMDGFALCRRLKAQPETEKIPVIFITSRSSTEEAILGLEAGGADYVTRPVNLPELLARIRVHLGRRLAGAKQKGPDETVLRQRLGLTHRESDVLTWLARGKANRDIAAILHLSPRTVDKHLEQIYAKLGVENRTAAVVSAVHALDAR